MHICLAQLSVRQEVDYVYPTTNLPLSPHWGFDNPQGQGGAPVQYRVVPELEDVFGGTGYIWKYPCSTGFQRYMTYLNYNCHRQAQNCVQRGAFAGHLPIGMMRFWCCPVHTWDVNHSMFFIIVFVLFILYALKLEYDRAPYPLCLQASRLNSGNPHPLPFVPFPLGGWDCDSNRTHCVCIRCISKKYSCPGGMALSEWTNSVRAARDTPVANYSAPGVNSTRRVPYRPLIAVPPFLLILSVSYFKRSLWRCGQLWPYVRMGSLGT